MLEKRNKEIENRFKDFRHTNVITKTKVTFHLNFFNWSFLNLQRRPYLPVPGLQAFTAVRNRINKIAGW